MLDNRRFLDGNVSSVHNYKIDSINNEGVKVWLSAYKNGVWEKKLPSFSSTGLNKIDLYFIMILGIWESLVTESSNFGIERSILKNFSENDNFNMDRRILLGKMDSDLFVGGLLIVLYEFHTKILLLSQEVKVDLEQEFIEQIDKILENVPYTKRDVESTEKLLKEFLNLPVWKHRYEIYSAWISTQIMNVLGYENLEFFVVDQTLSFPFSKSILSIAKNYSPEVQVWTELRTPLINPIGKGRSKGIQPDYSLLTDPTDKDTQVRSTILIIECKQYLKASRTNFYNAIFDYARGCPNANVLLVNYGPADNSILNKLEASIRDRVYIIGNMKPGSLSSLSLFKEYVQNALPSNKIINKELIIENSETQRLELFWDDQNCDLDLHLNIMNDGILTEINFKNSGESENISGANLVRDIQSGGSGPEILQINHKIPGIYIFFVHKYCGEKELFQSRACVSNVQGGKTLDFQCPSTGTGSWWILYSYNSNDGKIIIYNKIINDFKIEDYL